MRVRTLAIASGAILTGFVAFAWVAWVHPRLVRARQITNWVELQTYVGHLDNYYATHGAYPAELAQAIPSGVAQRDRLLRLRDLYGNPLHYESDGVRFLLASYGRDGVRDTREYFQNAGAGGLDHSPCYDESVDTVYSSDGTRQICGK